MTFMQLYLQIEASIQFYVHTIHYQGLHTTQPLEEYHGGRPLRERLLFNKPSPDIPKLFLLVSI